MRVWVDQDMCTGDGLCVDHAPDVFVLLEDGISYVHHDHWLGNDPGMEHSSRRFYANEERDVIAAALDCPGECIFLEPDPEDLVGLENY